MAVSIIVRYMWVNRISRASLSFDWHSYELLDVSEYKTACKNDKLCIILGFRMLGL